MSTPVFPNFKTLELDDLSLFREYIHAYQPETSDWTFTNLFMWREYYRYHWTLHQDNLIVLANPLGWGHYFMMPIGLSNRGEICQMMLEWLKEDKEEYDPRIERADQRFVDEIGTGGVFVVESVRDQHDYVYTTKDLIKLEGRKYHAKKNHINRFRDTYTFEYRTMSEELSGACLHVLKRWCDWRECEKNPVMRAEMEATQQALIHFSRLDIKGAVIFVDDKMVTFTFGEQLNNQTAVIHVEKTDPKVPEGFAMINQQFCEHQWYNLKFMNREQDLGIPGLRKAKKSYHPHHMVEKFRVRLKQTV